MLLLINYSNNSRDLKKIINQILKKNLANEVKRLNYVKSYKLIDNKVTKREEKLVLVDTEEDKLQEIRKIFKNKDSDCCIRVVHNEIIT